ncbi:Crp/Fnr family transcriptional regulator [Streptomyces sp. 3214.6]|uniref:Crp/Fnr family transcriptional regulator n=1 Tax=Streptomyces sp. 3214.6 TaxID=1882757 RepID=UPI000909BA9D|nr:helix-turn-helix domain-containing protein [Streptomyces sp. 3214.6]SHH32512.1 cAMP-binding domain of CRP or a regulatory subunit of cAMP-dependent protein kinases [Streptomyces sp. 3214.6]
MTVKLVTAQRRFTGDLFGNQIGSKEVVDALAKVMTAHVLDRDELAFGYKRRGQVFFLVSGCIREERTLGHTRLWKAGTMFGRWASARSSFASSGWALADTTGLSANSTDIYNLAMEHGEVCQALARMDAFRMNTLDGVYCASRQSPLGRVARLLIYLSEDAGRGYQTRSVDGRRVVKFVPGGIVDGPSQGDLADALALGRATVEKALATLREDGILARPTGKRTNRFYEILDRDRLDNIARGV